MNNAEMSPVSPETKTGAGYRDLTEVKSDIPEANRFLSPLPNGTLQLLDDRKIYRFDQATGKYVEGQDI